MEDNAQSTVPRYLRKAFPWDGIHVQAHWVSAGEISVDEERLDLANRTNLGLVQDNVGPTT